MAQQISSKTLLGATEITLVADILPGFVPIAEVTTYSARLRTVLRTLFNIRKLAIERDGRFNSAGPLESLRMLHAVHWSLIENDRRLLLAVSFDGPWEPYIRTIVDIAGPLLDLIFCNCVGYRGHMCADGYPAFAEWVRERQQDCDFFYKGSPDLTVDDIRYLQGHEQGAPAGYHVGPLQGQLSLQQRATLAATISGVLEPLFPPAPQRERGDDASVFERARSLFVGDTELAPAPVIEATQANSDDTQGNILTSYSKSNQHAELMTVGSLSLLHFEDAAAGAGFLKAVIEEITTEAKAQKSALKLNVALTLRGLEKLGVSANLLALLPPEFKQGMSGRAGLLGDVGQNHPEHWELPDMNLDEPTGERVNLATVDAIVMLEQAEPGPDAPGDKDPHRWSAQHPHYPIVKAWHRGGVQVLHVQALRRYDDKGHFNIKDGVSQPAPYLAEPRLANARDSVPLGEILTGYANERGEPPRRELEELLKNGSFLALRKIEQHVDEFESFVDDNEDTPDFIAKMVGRHPDGKALVHGQYDNDFDYGEDADGVRCPLHAHIRRANPRSTNPVVESESRSEQHPRGRRVVGAARTPRIVRRGMSYGPKAGGEPRGLMFMAYQASLADQYEVVQRWVNGGNVTGILSAHPDLLAGNFPVRSNRTLSYPNADGSVTHVAVPPRPLTTLKWGIYAFAPSITSLRELAKLDDGAELATRQASLATAAVAPAAAVPAEPPPWLSELLVFDAHGPRDQAVARWKELLESRDMRKQASALWQYIRKAGPLRTTYGVLVGSAEGVAYVLSTHATFSVREYWRRLSGSFGGHYLGMDPAPKIVEGDDYHEQVAHEQYFTESKLPNAYLATIGEREAFHLARGIMEQVLSALPEAGGKRRFSARELAREVIGRISAELFGMPDGTNMLASGTEAAAGEPKSRCPLDFTRVSQLVFNPEPTATLTAVANERGAAVDAAVRPFAQGEKPSRFCSYLRHEGFSGDLTQALIGAINGFVVPTSGSFLSALSQWIDGEDLWQLRRWLLAEPADVRDLKWRLKTGTDVTDLDIRQNRLTNSLIAAMTRAAVPELLHRKVVDSGSIEGFPVRAGERVVINLGSAAAHTGDWNLLFGGDYAADSRPLHACPGQKMAFGVLLGMFTVLLRLPNLSAGPGLVLSFDAV